MSQLVPDQMSDVEQELADQIYDAIQADSNFSERSQQSADFRIGISDLGYCSEKVRRMLAGIPEPVTDKLPAFIGTAIGDYAERAIVKHLWPDAICQATVSVDLVGERGTFTVTGHPDLVVPSGFLVDVKTSRGLAVPRRNGPSQQQQFQRHCYALGAWEKGLFGDLDLDEIQVANVWIDRAADYREVHVHAEPFNRDVVIQAGFWVDDLVYAYLHDEEARKEPPLTVCENTCGHFADCRIGDALTGAAGLVDDPDVVTAAQVYKDGLAMESAGRKLKDEAKANLVGITGSTGKYAIRWIHIGESHVEYDRAAYERLEVRDL
jgi:hypothetical protein